MSLLVLCLFLLYRLLNMFRDTLCPSSGADDVEVFIRCVAAVAVYAVRSDWLLVCPLGSTKVHLSATNRI